MANDPNEALGVGSSLLVAIVQHEDAPNLVDEVTRRGHRATRINASGGFLSVGNDVILMGLERAEVGDVLDSIAATCRTRTAFHFHVTGDLTIDGSVGPIEVEVGGAVVFVLPVEARFQLQGRYKPGRAPGSAR